MSKQREQTNIGVASAEATLTALQTERRRLVEHGAELAKERLPFPTNTRRRRDGVRNVRRALWPAVM